ncbi:MAG: hypothetical protein GXO67_04770 [Archaeoglobi archaeon]|nr:hypothetical protein [Archaeoglobi archaeon]
MRALDVNSSHVTLQFKVKMSKPERLENLSLIVKFTDMQTNLLVSEFSKPIPEKTKSDYTAVLNCSVSKSHNYRVRVLLEQDGETLSMREMRMYGLSSLPPAEKSVDVTVRDADFRLLNKTGEFVRVRVTYYIDTPRNSTVEFHLKAVQLESNVMADDQWVERELQKDRTNLVSFELTLRDEYNYRIVLELWNAGYLVKSWSHELRLNPEKSQESKVEEEKGFRVEDFITETRVPVPTPYEEKRLASPGFELLTLAIAGGGALWMRKRR